MGKVADRYFKVDPWLIVEEGFDPDHGRVAESIFSLANEHMGVRGYFDEGYSGDRLAGVYLNGVYEEAYSERSPYRGIANRMCYMANTVDWLYTRICLDGETLDLARSTFSGFDRRLDLRSGLLERRFVWTTAPGKQLRLAFLRLLSMTDPWLGCQRVVLEPLNFSGAVEVQSVLDFSIVHESRHRSLFDVLEKGEERGVHGMLGRTGQSGHMVYAGFILNIDGPRDAAPAGSDPSQFGPSRSTSPVQPPDTHRLDEGKLFGLRFNLDLRAGRKTSFDKLVALHAEKRASVGPNTAWAEGCDRAAALRATGFDRVLADNARYWQSIWDTFDIRIEGDPENLQGIRYCIFQLSQTYHGSDPTLNIGAKGLTGEAYNGHAFWDTETYCLPFFLFTNPGAARNLLDYRYNTLPKALERAEALDCTGACYPIATLDGSECCDLWQHASLQFQPSTGVAYGIWHYDKVTHDRDFLYSRGVEMLIQISRFLATRGQWGARTGEFGYFCVMGPDEFQMMVNNNAYTNFMARKTFEYTVEVLVDMRANAADRYAALVDRLRLDAVEIEDWKLKARKMRIPLDAATGIYEQHDGYFDLPHVDVDSIPVTDFPLYAHWTYDRIYRNDMIKQPDVLMFMFLYNQQFSLGAKRANYEYYEPRCIHESSLSPSIHSIFASELGRHREAFDFFGFATRLDLDNYNRNTGEGLHLTSIAAAWVNIVYGFGGMRSDGDMLVFNPSIPAAWQSYSFRVRYLGSVIEVEVHPGLATFQVTDGDPVAVRIYGTERLLGPDDLAIAMPSLPMPDTQNA